LSEGELRCQPLGDGALQVILGEGISPALSARIAGLQRFLEREQRAGQLNGILDTIPAYRTLTIAFDPQLLTADQLQQRLLHFWQQADEEAVSPRYWKLPVCYHPDFGCDLELVARLSSLTTDEVVQLHSNRFYTVYMIGFLPGFPYLGDIDSRLALPRLAEPRLRVAPGSVAIAGGQTAIYPWESPGGWYLLGRSPVPLFDPSATSPCLLRQGDLVCFEAITHAEYVELENALQHPQELTQFLTSGGML